MVDVIAIDGTGGVGKGTLASSLSRHLKWHLLDSGALYRIVAYQALAQGIDLDNGEALGQAARQLQQVVFTPGTAGEPAGVLLAGEDIGTQIRSDAMGSSASRVAKHLQVREGLLHAQRGCAEAPGLVADGRDMGTRVFTDARLKIFLTASAEERAKRRYGQLHGEPDLNNPAHKDIIHQLVHSISQRDAEDMQRKHNPLHPAPDAKVLDSTGLSAQQVFAQALIMLEQAGIG